MSEGICQLCNKYKDNIEMHHQNPENRRIKGVNVLYICHECHMKEHKVDNNE